MICPCYKTNNVDNFLDSYTLSSTSWSSRSFTSTQFHHKPYYCTDCGHIFNGIPPTSKTLEAYYADQITHIAEGYCADKRLSVIMACAGKYSLKKILDFGGNTKQSFHKTLAQNDFDVEVADVGMEITGKQFDIITSYFVFEHLVDLDVIIEIFSQLLSASGKLIIEVPDASMYQDNYSALLCEHQQHFQMSSLAHLMARNGFTESFRSVDKCSRDFGFVSVFDKSNSSDFSTSKDASVVAKYIAGRENQIAANNFPKRFFGDAFKHVKLICFWG